MSLRDWFPSEIGCSVAATPFRTPPERYCGWRKLAVAYPILLFLPILLAELARFAAYADRPAIFLQCISLGRCMEDWVDIGIMLAVLGLLAGIIRQYRGASWFMEHGVLRTETLWTRGEIPLDEIEWIEYEREATREFVFRLHGPRGNVAAFTDIDSREALFTAICGQLPKHILVVENPWYDEYQLMRRIRLTGIGLLAAIFLAISWSCLIW